MQDAFTGVHKKLGTIIIMTRRAAQQQSSIVKQEHEDDEDDSEEKETKTPKPKTKPSAVQKKAKNRWMAGYDYLISKKKSAKSERPRKRRIVNKHVFTELEDINDGDNDE